jgi:hypothetical protein
MNILNEINFFKADSNKKIKIIMLLTAVVLAIFLLDFVLSGYFNKQKKGDTVSLKDEILTIDAAVDNILTDYGVKKEWKSKQSFQLKDDLVRFERTIRIPYNFPVVDMNHEISSLCSRYNSTTTSSEDIKNQIIQLRICDKGLVIQNIKLITDPSLLRIDGNFVAIMKGLSELDDIPKSFVLKSPLFKTFLMDYHKENSETIRLLNKLSKEYFVELNIKEKMEDEEFDVSLNMDSTILRKKLRNIIKSQENALGFFISYDKYDDKFNSLLKKEISNLHKEMLMKSDVVILKEENGGFSNFPEAAKQSLNIGYSLCIMNLTDKNINNLIENMRGIQKKGFRFVKISEILNKTK